MFGELAEQAMIDKIFETWGDGELDVAWFMNGPNSARNIIRHPLNRQLQEVTTESYVARMERSGLILDAASSPWLQWSSSNSEQPNDSDREYP
eukprot:5116653-Karenia_brevis.AAC.1